MEIEVFIIFCMETDNMEKEGSLSMEIEGIPLEAFPHKGTETFSPPSLTSAAPFSFSFLRGVRVPCVVCRPVIGPFAPSWTPLIPLKGKGGQI